MFDEIMKILTWILPGFVLLVAHSRLRSAFSRANSIGKQKCPLMEYNNYCKEQTLWAGLRVCVSFPLPPAIINSPEEEIARKIN